jgi:hypothetical protein
MFRLPLATQVHAQVAPRAAPYPTSILEIPDFAIGPRDIALLIVGKVTDYRLEGLTRFSCFRHLLRVDRLGIGHRHRNHLHGRIAVKREGLGIDVLGLEVLTSCAAAGFLRASGPKVISVL